MAVLSDRVDRCPHSWIFGCFAVEDDADPCHCQPLAGSEASHNARQLFSVPRERNLGEETGSAIDAEVKAIVDCEIQRTIGILNKRRDTLEGAARRLLEKEPLDQQELTDLVGPKLGLHAEADE